MRSILDNDLYKFSVSWAYMKLYPEAEGTFTFCDRNKETFDNEFLEQLKIEFTKLASRTLTLGEQQWCEKNISYIGIRTKDGKVQLTATDKIVYVYSSHDAQIEEEKTFRENHKSLKDIKNVNICWKNLMYYTSIKALLYFDKTCLT